MFVRERTRKKRHAEGSGVEDGEWIKEDERLLSSFNVACLLAGILLFIFGTVIQMTVPRYPEISELVSKCVKPSSQDVQLITVCRNAILSFDQTSHRAEGLSWALLLADLLRNAGMAVVLSIIISVTLERQSQERFSAAMSSKIRELSLSVFQGMFNRRHPPALLSAVKAQILERDLIRESLSVTYTLSLWEPPAEAVRLAGQCFVRVDVLLSSAVVNVSTVTSGTTGVARVPIGLALPNPMIDELKALVRINDVVVNGLSVGQDALREQNERLQEAFRNDGEDDVFVTFGEREISPDETLLVSANYSMMKEIEDTEVFRTLQITKSLMLTVHDNTGKDLKVRAKAIHAKQLEKMASSAATTQWRLSDILLPQQGIIVWWKKPLLTRAVQEGNVIKRP